LLIALVLAGGISYLYIKHSATPVEENAEQLIRDKAGLTQVEVSAVVRPTSEMEIVEALRNSTGAVSIGGARYSMGGQTAYPGSLHFDMRHFNQVVEFDPAQKQITVQSGITWRDLQHYIDPHDLSVQVMQDFNNFTVGGSLGVNAHGRFVKAGQIINSVVSFRMVLADGQVYEASPQSNNALFYGAIGGYGGLGVISHVTLQLVDNIPLLRSVKNLEFHEFTRYFVNNVLNDPEVELHHAVLYPPSYEALASIAWRRTDLALTEQRRLHPPTENPILKTVAVDLLSGSNLLKRLRKNLFDPYINSKQAVVWRNWETSYDVNDFGFLSTENEALALRMYTVPLSELEIFVLKMRDIFIRHEASVLNISIRYIPRDPGSILAWAREDSFSFTIVYHQKKTDEALEATRLWSRELIQAAIDSHGSYYLPFQIHETTGQFAAAYPNAGAFFRLKQQADPKNRFRNMLWLEHYAGNQQDKLSFERTKQDTFNLDQDVQPIDEQAADTGKTRIISDTEELTVDGEPSAPTSASVASEVPGTLGEESPEEGAAGGLNWPDGDESPTDADKP
jgi:FAD/FMN-containing dehydrogenase